MVHVRLNERDLSRNPAINFIEALPGPSEDEAERRLRQLAAIFKPIMQEVWQA